MAGAAAAGEFPLQLPFRVTNLKPAPDRALAVTLAVTVAVRAAGLPTAAAGASACKSAGN